MNMKGSLIMVVIYISLMIINVMHFVGGPEDHPQAQRLVRIQRTQDVVILMVLIYYSERTHRKSSKGKRQMG